MNRISFVHIDLKINPSPIISLFLNRCTHKVMKNNCFRLNFYNKISYLLLTKHKNSVFQNSLVLNKALSHARKIQRHDNIKVLILSRRWKGTSETGR